MADLVLHIHRELIHHLAEAWRRRATSTSPHVDTAGPRREF